MWIVDPSYFKEDDRQLIEEKTGKENLERWKSNKEDLEACDDWWRCDLRKGAQMAVKLWTPEKACGEGLAGAQDFFELPKMMGHHRLQS